MADAGTLTLYVDGQPTASQAIGAVSLSDSTLWIGGHPDQPRSAVGRVAEVAVYGTALPDARLSARAAARD